MCIRDSDRNILASVSIALESEGYRVQTYTDGASALDGFQSVLPDLAILDIKMPRMDGMELLRRLRQKTDLPVIFLTSKDDEIDELFGLKMGADDFITKPFSRRLLVERVKAILRRASSREAAASAGGSAGTPAKAGEAVSYTHLDVYKRQLVDFELSRLLRSQNPSTASTRPAAPPIMSTAVSCS